MRSQNSITSQLERMQHKQQQQQQQNPTPREETRKEEDVFSEQHLFSALTWGHNDQRLFVACSATLHILRVFKEIPKFSLLAQMCVKSQLKEAIQADNLCLPQRLVQQIKHCFSSTIKVCCFF